MKKTKVLSLVLGTALLTGGAFGFYNVYGQKKPKYQVKMESVENLPDIKYKIDTIYLTNSNIKHYLEHGAGGVYTAFDNTINISHYVPVDKAWRITKFAENNNAMAKFTLRHETEHARKAILFKNMMYRDNPLSRARMAIMNEIMAPSSEIIEAVDYYQATGEFHPGLRSDMAPAPMEIVEVWNKSNRYGSIDYAYRPIADIILKYAQKSFYSAVSRGFYRTTIEYAWENWQVPAFVKNSESPKYNNTCMFNPRFDLWDAAFTFKGENGQMYNVYRGASRDVRQQMLARADSLVNTIVNRDSAAIPFRYGTLRSKTHGGR